MWQSGEIIELPGLVDLHVHLREPSTNNAENIESGTRAAARGGYVLLGDMPNNPGSPTWTEARQQEKHGIIREKAIIPVTAHVGSQPESDNIGELEAMAANSLWYKIYATKTTGNDREYEARDFEPNIAEWHRVAPDKPIGLHAGRDNLADFIALIAGEYEHPLHIHHINSPHQVSLINQFKREGLRLTSGVTIHHLLKTSHDTKTEGWFARMQPPLATQTEADRLLRLLAAGEIDIIETDHAPHTAESKWKAEHANPDGSDEHESTCYGVPAIEFAASLMFYQVKRGNISLQRAIDALSTRPAQILGVQLSEYTRVRWQMDEYRIREDEEMELSGSGWTPFAGKLAVGKVVSIETAETFMLPGSWPRGGHTGNRDPRVITQRGAVI